MTLPPVQVRYPHVSYTDSGSPMIEGTKVPVRRIWIWHRRGVYFEAITKRYPNIPPGVLLSVLAFAYDNRDLIEADIARENAMLSNVEPVPGAMQQMRLSDGQKKDR